MEIAAMNTVLVANRDLEECKQIKKALGDMYKVLMVTKASDLADLRSKADLAVLDQNFTDRSGIDALPRLLENSYIPVLMVTAPDDPRCAIEAVRLGAYNYLVKTEGYLDLLYYSIKEAIEKYNEREEMLRTINALKQRIAELEKRLESTTTWEGIPATTEDRAGLIEAITSRFRRGEINLPSYPKINSQFRILIEEGAPIGRITRLLKQDVGISSKLLSISNSPYYCGLHKNKTLEQAVSRLGLKTTKNYVEIISNRSLYTTNNEKYKEPLKRLWKHSLSCAYASEIISRHLQMETPDEVFTMGLMHDIGKLLLMQVAIELETNGAFGGGIDRKELIHTLDAYHGSFGSSLLKKWNFPQQYSDIAQYHHNPDKTNSISKELMVVHLANLLSRHMGYSLDVTDGVDLENAVSLKFLDIDLDILQRIEGKVSALMHNAASI
ncbi:MAG: HDOD domain-containing protein [Deltaproteobacteria bacterium]|nr:HDOD domain-containing protein [Deltaproteobacteria bacterium]